MKRFDTINVLPFIDIMLVLLAIVLTTATFIAQGDLPVALPIAHSAAAASDQPPGLSLTINATGAVFLDDQPIALAALQEKIAALPPSTTVVLQVDKAAAFGAFVSVIDVLKAQHLDQLSIRTLNAS